MNPDNPQIISFLSANRLEGAERLALSGDASHRRYERIIKNNKKFMLMVAPIDKEDIRPFIKIDGILREAGFNAPEIIASDAENGLLLLEDFGDELFSRILAENLAEEEELYREAIELLAKLPQKADLPRYSNEKLLEEAALLVDWHLTAADKKEYLAIWHELLAKLDNSKQVLVLRDYHADNLMWLPERSGRQRIGLLDFQDAVIGHPAYDLASLLEDARRDVAQDIVVAALKNRTAGFVRDYFILAAQRNCKIIGIFNRLQIRDGKEIYLQFLPRVWNHLRNDLKYPALAPLKTWMEKNAGEYALS
jgi:aminoglycoside/choline kinase family phosphotransferase